jgi:pyruvate dehydrogenase (quinone)/pyruvate oxidase
MANGLPYAIAAALARPERPSIAFVGDGGLSMLMAEVATCVKYNLPVKIVVLNNGSLAKIKWEQIALEGNPEYGCDLAPIDYVKFADACGVKGHLIEKPADCGPVFDEALAADGPAIIEARIDPFEPPMPAKIKPRYAANLMKSFAKGQPGRAQIAKAMVSDKAREMV